MPPKRKLADWHDAYLAWTVNTEPALRFRRWAAISAISAALERKAWITWMKTVLYPNLYVVFVAPSGIRKSTSIDPAHKLIRNLGGVCFAPDATSVAAMVSHMSENRRKFVHAKSECEHSSMFVCADEFSVFVGQKDIDRLGYLCKFYDCDNDFLKHTNYKGAEKISGICVGVLAGTTPDSLRDSMPSASIGGGFASRNLFVYAKRVAKRISPFSKEAIETPLLKQLRDDLQQDLITIHENLIGEFTPDESYCAAFNKWYLEAKQPEFLKHNRYGGYISRRPTHIAKLSIVSCASRSNEMVMSEIDFNRARGWLREIELTLPSVYESMGANSLAAIQTDVMDYIRDVSTPTQGAEYYKLTEMFAGDIGISEVNAVLTELTLRGYVKYVPGASHVILATAETPATQRLAFLEQQGVLEEQDYLEGKSAPAANAEVLATAYGG